MDVAYATEMTDGVQKFRVLRGDGESFGLHEGKELPLASTYGQHVLGGELPNLMGDLSVEPLAASKEVTGTAGVGSFCSVPLVFSDGTTYGTLCAASHPPTETLGGEQLQFLHVFARMIADQIERETLERASREAKREASLARALLAAVEARDSYTAEHSRAVVANAAAVAERLDLDEETTAEVRQVALLHDIGKLSVPDEVLRKPGPLTEEETVTMRGHSEAGAKLVSQVDELAHLGPAIAAEHERWDGDGYPAGLSGEEIPVASRITLVCDAYDAMTSDRPYRVAMKPSEARAEIEAGLGGQFCPYAGQALLDHLDGAEPGPAQADGAEPAIRY